MNNYEIRNNPPPFPEGSPGFIKELCKPSVPHHFRKLPGEPTADEADLRSGIDFQPQFPDPEGLLNSAYKDLVRFLKAASIPSPGTFPFETRKVEDLKGESFRLDVSRERIVLEAGGTEGIRRGIYFFEEELAGNQSPFLKIGIIRRDPWLKNRISRCFFGPIKRAPFYRDELMDDINYYPDEYLNKLAKEGVNGLWLTISFRDICKTSITKADQDSEKRLEKLRKTVAQCRRYGIKIWVFCIEPAAWSRNNPVPEGYGELEGPDSYDMQKAFCPNSQTAERYLYESTKYLFNSIPNLGGMIIISYGERTTSCLGCIPIHSNGAIQCEKRCALSIGEIMSKVLTPMRNGIRDAAPEAELISWLYLPYAEQLPDWIYEMPEKLSKDIILAFNFESGCNKPQLGKIRVGGDYWLSCVGPSDRFARMAWATKGKCAMAAKLQVGCSHEVATIPFVPVPGVLYRKYKAMRRLGVEHVIQCWYFGNYPGIMNRAAGRLAFEDFSGTEEKFLEDLARPEWGTRAHDMANVWQILANAYSNYPLDIQFQYYGPMHDGTVWPLHLKTVMKQLPRSWKPDQEPAGDAIGECMINHSLEELIVLSEMLSVGWNQGNDKLQNLASEFKGQPEREKDISLIEALNIQFKSGYNILRFYYLRDALQNAHCNALGILDEMSEIVNVEISASQRLAELCESDPRLGYHSEAEVYKYFPDKLRWRADVLENILETDFTAFRSGLETGIVPEELIYGRTETCSIENWYGGESMRWRSELSKSNIKFIVETKAVVDAMSERLWFFIIDRKNTVKPWIIRIEFNPGAHPERNPESKEPWMVIDNYSSSKIHVEESTNGERKLTVSIPCALLDLDAGFYFGIQRDWNGPDKMERHENYPPGNYVYEYRLNLGYFSPGRLALLKFC